LWTRKSKVVEWGQGIKSFFEETPIKKWIIT
jgi:hypothetical protein